MRRQILALCCTLALGATSCDQPRTDTIRIGILPDCDTFGAPFYDVSLAGAELPLLRRGGSLDPSHLEDGVQGVSVGGHAVELVFGCAGDSVRTAAETRRLVEVEGVDVVIGPNVFPNVTLVDYARRHPTTTFVIATLEQYLGNVPPNVFRLTATSMQMAAGLGSYAFGELGWRSATTIASPDLWQWGIYGGFLAEFCSLGGRIPDRYWLESSDEEITASLAEIPLDAGDGFFLSVKPGDAATFLRRYSADHPSLSRRVILGAYATYPVSLDPEVVKGAGDSLKGIVTATFVPLDGSQDDWNAFVSEFGSSFPALADAADSTYHLVDIDYVNAMEAVMLALEAVDGDLSHRASGFQFALSDVRLDAPNGTISLDDRRQAILPIYLSRVERGDDGDLVLRTFRKIEAVDQSYGGLLNAEVPVPDRTYPPCVEGDPPPWATAVS
jgi:branched-chain amino acid transport system substrate-binding protein